MIAGKKYLQSGVFELLSVRMCNCGQDAGVAGRTLCAAARLESAMGERNQPDNMALLALAFVLEMLPLLAGWLDG